MIQYVSILSNLDDKRNKQGDKSKDYQQ